MLGFHRERTVAVQMPFVAERNKQEQTRQRVAVGSNGVDTSRRGRYLYYIDHSNEADIRNVGD